MIFPRNLTPQPVRDLPVLPETIAGIDPSLTASGVCLLNAGRAASWVIPVPEGLHPVARLAWYAEEFPRICQQYGVTAVGIEGYAFGMKGQDSRAHSLGELGGVLRLALYGLGIPTMVAPPTTLKKFLTGVGTGKKEIIIKELLKRFALDVNDNNEADAAVVGIMALYKFRGGSVTKFQADALKGCEVLPLKPRPAVRLRTRPAA